MTFVLRAIYVCIDTVPVSLVVLPLSVEDVTIYVPELALPMSFVVYPLPLVACAIWPDLDPVTMTNSSLPLALVYRSVLKLVLLSELKRLVLINLILIDILVRVLLVPMT